MFPNAKEKMFLSEFSRVVEGKFFQGFTFVDFTSFMGYLAKICGDGVTVAVDEFQRLTNIDGAMSMVQKYWDEKMSNAECLLILSGCSMGGTRRVALVIKKKGIKRHTRTLLHAVAEASPEKAFVIRLHDAEHLPLKTSIQTSFQWWQ